MLENIISIEEARDVANIPEKPKEALEDVSLTDVYNLINRYHRKRGSIRPDRYELSLDNRTRGIDTTIGRTDGSNIELQKVNMRDVHHSMYSESGLEDVMVDIDNSWNGDKATFSYKDGILDVFKSDYYTTTSFCELLYLEAIKEINESGDYTDANLDNLEFRDKYLRDKDKIERPPWMARGGTIGGVIIANTGNMWKLILGRRSQKTRINPGRISIIPNGGMEYENISKGKMEQDLRLKFNEELFRGLRQPHIFDRFVDAHRVSTGWDLRDSTLNVGYALIIDDPEGYSKIKEQRNHNFQFNSSVEIDISNFGVLISRANMRYMSPSVLPTVYRSISLVNEMYDSVDIPYEINQK